MTRAVYAIVGDPVGQVRSPEVFNALYAERGVNAIMVPLEVPSGRLEPMLASLRLARNLGGIIVTIPHKLEAATVAVRSSERVQLVGAANALRPADGGWEADLFDGVGFLNGLRARGVTAAGKRVSIVGAGGAGLAIAGALLSAGAAAVTICDQDRAKADAAVARLQRTWPAQTRQGAPDASVDIAVNATPAGMRPDDPLPIDLDRIAPSTLVADAIMRPPVTALLAEAARRGHPILEGRRMLDGQVEPLWRFLGMGA
jgi:shikimate dehydrogenase